MNQRTRVGLEPPTFPPCMQVMVNSFEDPTEIGEALADWADNARHTIVVPLLEEMKRRAATRPPSSIRTEFGQPGDCWLALDAEPARGTRTKLYDYNDKNWERLVKELRAGRLRYLNLGGSILDDWGSPTWSLARFALTIDFPGIEFAGFAHSIQMWATETLFPDGISGGTQKGWVELGKQAAVSTRATTGYITHDHLFTVSPYEEALNVHYGRDDRKLGNLLRGYYWANFLSPGHIESLGGMDRIRAEAPCHLIEDLSGGHGQLAYLQLTPHLVTVSDDDLRSLKTYFEPLLLPGTPGHQYTGPPLRLV